MTDVVLASEKLARSFGGLQAVDGVMVGREAYHHPWLMADWDQRYFGATGPLREKPGYEEVVEAFA